MFWATSVTFIYLKKYTNIPLFEAHFRVKSKLMVSDGHLSHIKYFIKWHGR